MNYIKTPNTALALTHIKNERLENEPGINKPTKADAEYIISVSPDVVIALCRELKARRENQWMETV